MTHTPEDIREKVIARLVALSTKHEALYRSPVSISKAGYPAYVLEFGTNTDQWSANKANVRTHVFNLYVSYAHENTEASQELAELAISECIGELHNVVFVDPTLAGVDSGWIKASDVTWGYGDANDVPTRVAMLQIIVTVHDTRV